MTTNNLDRTLVVRPIIASQIFCLRINKKNKRSKRTKDIKKQKAGGRTKMISQQTGALLQFIFMGEKTQHKHKACDVHMGSMQPKIYLRRIYV